MGWHPPSRINRSSLTPSTGGKTRSPFATRPFAPPETAAEVATDTSVQRQTDRSTPPSLDSINIPLFSSNSASALGNSSGAIQRQELTESAQSGEENLSIQAKLAIGKPNDRYEQEADRVAVEVVNQINAPPPSPIQRMDNLEEEEIQTKPLTGSITPVVQRMDNLEEEEIQTKPQTSAIAPSIQRMDNLEEDDLQMMPVQQVAAAGGTDASPDVESAIAQARSGGQPIDSSVREPIERVMKADFSGVKIHTDAQADQLSRSVQARAFTTGQDVFFRQGEYNPGSRGGQELIAHELTHVVQQNSGTINCTRIQKISEEDSQYAEITFSQRATEHGYTQLELDRIMRNRFQEITEGDRQSMRIGQGTEENSALYGQILYNCHRDNTTQIMRIHIYHAHGQGKMG